MPYSGPGEATVATPAYIERRVFAEVYPMDHIGDSDISHILCLVVILVIFSLFGLTCLLCNSLPHCVVGGSPSLFPRTTQPMATLPDRPSSSWLRQQYMGRRGER